MTHGHTRNRKPTKEFNTYAGMIQRCTNPNNPRYPSYGGRGIKICDRWLECFENFFEDMGTAPSSRHSIDRINMNGNYEPSNCRWATVEQQSNNKRNNNYIEYKGKVLTITQWALELNINTYALRKRLKLWTIEDAFTRPYKPDTRDKIIQYDLEGNFIKEWANISQVCTALRFPRKWMIASLKSQPSLIENFTFKYKTNEETIFKLIANN